MNQYRFEFLNDNNAPMAKCRYQIMQNDSILYQDIADENGRAAFNSELVAGKKIRVRFWAEGQRQDAAFSTEPFYWTENVITQPIKAPKVYEVKLRETQNKNNEPANYRQAFYEVQAGDTWEGIAKKCNTNALSIKFLNNLPDDSTLPEVGDALLLPQGAERPLDSGSPSDKGVIESHSNEPQNDSLKGLDEKTPGPEQDKPSILPQEVAPSVAENQPEHPPTIVENKKPEAKKKKDTIGDLLKKLDEEKSEQEKGKQSKSSQGAEPAGQDQPKQVKQPIDTNLIADEEKKPTEKKDSKLLKEDPDIQKGRGRNGRPTDRVIREQCPNCTTLTIEEIDQIFTKATKNKKDILISSFLEVNQKFGLDSCQQKAHFFAQVLQEVGKGIDIKQGENLNYRVDALPMHFSRFSVTKALGGAPNELAYQYGRVERKIGGKIVVVQPANQKMIANIAYAGRNGNGNIESGDGWRFRGKGIIQVTGRKKYTLINNVIVKYYPSSNIVIDADNINNLREGTIASMAYWLGSGCKKQADLGIARSNLDAIVDIVNRYTPTREARWKNLEDCIAIFKVNTCKRIRR